MSDKKQSSVDFILNAFNLLSDSDFKSWMLNNYDKIKAMHKEENRKTWIQSVMSKYKTFEHYYNETFGGQDNGKD